MYYIEIKGHFTPTDNTMKHLLVILLAATVISCTPKIEMPPPAISDQAAAKILKGKKWNVTRMASLGTSPNGKQSYTWLDEQQNVTEFVKKSYDKLAATQFTFVSDTLANVEGVEDALLAQSYWVALDENVDVSAPILKFTFAGEGDLSKLTYSYPIYGISENALLLGTPNTINESEVVLLMEAK